MVKTYHLRRREMQSPARVDVKGVLVVLTVALTTPAKETAHAVKDAMTA